MGRFYLLLLCFCLPSSLLALENDSKVPVLLYHSKTGGGTCDYGTSDLVALEQDIQTLQQEGFTVMPLYEVVRWQLGWRSSSSMPDKVVALTFDDGFAADANGAYDPCGQGRSVHNVLANAGVHGSTFVIASEYARNLISPQGLHSHSWWNAINNSVYMTVYNHSLDHDHMTIDQKIMDGYVNVYIPSGGYADGIWEGLHDPLRFTNWSSNNAYIRKAGEFIETKIGEFPEIFAYPFGPEGSSYQINTYFPNYPGQHKTIAAMCTEIEGPKQIVPGNYVTRNSNRYCLPRFTKGPSWNSTQELINILDGSQ